MLWSRPDFTNQIRCQGLIKYYLATILAISSSSADTYPKNPAAHGTTLPRLTSDTRDGKLGKNPVVMAVASNTSGNDRIRALSVVSNFYSASPKPDPTEQHFSTQHKLCLVLAATVYICAISFYTKKLIDDYESDVSIERPPWYTDTTMLLKVSGILLTSWVLLGIGFFNQVLFFSEPPRHLTVIESLYLLSQIVTTVGYGDLTPSEPIGQMFVAIYVILGVTLMAFLVSELIDHLPNVSLHTSALRNAEEAALEEATGSRSRSTMSAGLSSMGRRALNQLDSGSFRVIKSTALCFLSIIVGTLFFCLYPGEDKDVWQAFYMSCVTLSTVGFGGYHPITEGGRLFATFWMLLGVASSANMICTVVDAWAVHRKHISVKFDIARILKEMDEDQSGKISKVEFMRYELVRMGHCKKNVIEDVLKKFDSMDANGDGEIDMGELKRLERMGRRSK